MEDIAYIDIKTKNNLFKKVNYYYTNLGNCSFLKMEIQSKNLPKESIFKLLKKYKIEKIVLSDAVKTLFSKDFSEHANMILTGNKIMKSMVFDIINFIEKTKCADLREKTVCIYCDTIDSYAENLIVSLSSSFKFINLASKDQNYESFCDKMFDLYGLTIRNAKFSEFDTLAIIMSDDFENKKFMINLTGKNIQGAVNSIKFKTKDGQIVGADFIEAFEDKLEICDNSNTKSILNKKGFKFYDLSLFC